jgi:hypothetical protein
MSASADRQRQPARLKVGTQERGPQRWSYVRRPRDDGVRSSHRPRTPRRQSAMGAPIRNVGRIEARRSQHRLHVQRLALVEGARCPVVPGDAEDRPLHGRPRLLLRAQDPARSCAQPRVQLARCGSRCPSACQLRTTGARSADVAWCSVSDRHLGARRTQCRRALSDARSGGTWAVVERWQEPDVAGILSLCRT